MGEIFFWEILLFQTLFLTFLKGKDKILNRSFFKLV